MGHPSHGLSYTSEYWAWCSMVARCTNPKNASYKRYGGRGIKICKRWRHFPAFYSDMGAKPFLKASLDRIDNNKGYSKKNCRWTTFKNQAINKSSTLLLEFNGETLTQSDWCKKFDISPDGIYKLRKRGIPFYEIAEHYASGGKGFRFGFKKNVAERVALSKIAIEMRESGRSRKYIQLNLNISATMVQALLYSPIPSNPLP